MRSSNPNIALPDLRSRYLPQAFENPPVANSTYAGPPTPDRDQSWREFMLPMNLRVRQEELEDLSAPAVQLPGGGYLARLGVFHEVHCLVCMSLPFEKTRLNSSSGLPTTMESSKLLLPRTHHGGSPILDQPRRYDCTLLQSFLLEAAEADFVTNKIDHCLELLRQSSVCHADAAIQTFRWDGHVPEPQLDVANEATHMCVDWDELMDSMRNRIVPTEEMAQLNNPLLSSSP